MSEPTEIAAWLEGLGLGQYAAAFEKNHLTVAMLPELTPEELKECGVVALGHRKAILAAIATLAAKPSTAPAKPPAPTSAKPAPTAPKPAARPPARTPIQPVPVATSEDAPAVAVAPPVPPPPTKPEARPTAPQGSVSPSAPPPVPITTPAHQRPGIWAKLAASKFLFISIVAHLLFGVGATYFIVQRIQAKRKVTFKGGPPSSNPSKRALEHKVSMAQKKKTGGAPPQAKRIVSAGIAKVSLPDLPTIPTASTVVPGMMAGMGGAGFGTGLGFGSGMGSGMSGGGGGGGSGMSLFGFRGAGVGLVGTFYDFKRDEQGKDTGVKRGNRPVYTEILREFARGGTWAVPAKHKHFTSKSKLGAKAFFFPAIADSEAGEAFQAPEAGAAMWVAHYTGTVTPAVSGQFRFVGWGDNVLIVGLNGNVVLDASDIGYVDKNRTNAGGVSFPKKAGTPLLEGEWFEVRAGSPMKVDVLLGDEGGIFCAGLHLQKKGENYGRGKGNIPELPLFLVAPLGAAEKKLYGEYLGEKAFSGPIFGARAGGTGSLLDALKR